MRSLPWSRLADSRGVLQPPCLFINCCGFLLWAQRKSGIIILPRSAGSSPFARYQTVQTLLLRTRLSSHRFWGDCEQKARRGRRTQLWASGKRAWTQRDNQVGTNLLNNILFMMAACSLFYAYLFPVLPSNVRFLSWTRVGFITPFCMTLEIKNAVLRVFINSLYEVPNQHAVSLMDRDRKTIA